MSQLIMDALYYLLVYVSLFASVYWLIILFKREGNILTDPKPKRYPSITMLIPAHNEENNLEAAVKSVLDQGYPNLRIIIIDDASTDGTAKIGRKLAKKRNVSYIRHKINKGKAAALNTGLAKVKTELVGFMDADSELTENTFNNMVGYFSNGASGVVASIVPKNDKNYLERMQKVEYVISSLMRKLLSFVDALYYTPGFALYKTKALEDLGGFDEKNITEDLEIGLRLKDNGYKIENCFTGKIRTVVPSNLKSLFRQRIRWYRGFLYNSRKYKHLFFNRTHKALGMFVLPLQIIILSLIFPLMVYSLVLLARDAVQSFIDLANTNFDIIFMIEKASFKMDPTVLFWYLCVMFLTVVLVRYSEKQLERINPLEYLMYLIVFPILNIMFWIISIILELFSVKKEW